MLKGPVSIGIEIDSQSIHAAWMRHGKPGYTNTGIPCLETLKEFTGPFTTDEEILNGLKNVRQQLSIGANDAVITCIGGKQTYAAQLLFRKLPDEEMKTALKFEIRKNLSFDSTNASIEYQYLAQPAKKNELVPVIVTAVASPQIQRYTRLFGKAGIPPTVIEVFPLTIANAFLLERSNLEKSDLGKSILHIGPDYSTLVIEGTGIPFYNRTIYFAAGELFGPGKIEPLSSEEVARRLATFTEEINRSLVYYESTFRTMTASVVTVLGSYAHPELFARITRKTGLAVTQLNLAEVYESKESTPPGKYDIAIALAMRGIS